jgi:hypothetical protein
MHPAYAELRDALTAALRHDREAQLAGRAAAMGQAYDDLDGRIPRDDSPESWRLTTALSFWDYWLDARNHDWAVFYGVSRDEWPVLAAEVAESLAADRAITNPRILSLVN